MWTLYGVGVAGGLVSGITGSGLDILTFSALTLMYRVDEKVATPTSVVLMAGNALTGFFWQGVVSGGMTQMAWQYWHACVPVVVVGAPLGAYLIRQRTRHFVARLLYASILAQFLAALLIVPQSSTLVATSATTACVGLLFFLAISSAGNRRQQRVDGTVTTVEAQLG